MPLIFKGTTIPASGMVKYNNTSLEYVKYGSTQVWTRQLNLFTSNTWSIRGNDTDECTNNSASKSIIVRETGGTGSSCFLYCWADVTAWTYLRMNYTVYHVQPYGHGMFGIGNFDSFVVTDWPSVTGIGWNNSINTYHTDPSGNSWGNGSINKTFTLTINVSSMTGGQCIGFGAVGRSSVQAATHLVLNSAILSTS